MQKLDFMTAVYNRAKYKTHITNLGGNNTFWLNISNFCFI